MTPITRRASLSFAAALLGGCSVLPERPYTERRQWPLVVARPAALPARPGGKVVLVRATNAGPGLEPRGLQTLAADGAMSVAHYEEWLVPPALGVALSLRGWLGDSGLFGAVIAPGSRADADYVLESELTALYAAPAEGQAHATLGLVLLRQSGLTAIPVLQTVISATAPLAQATPEAAQAAMRAALASVFARVETALAGCLS